MVGLLWVLGFLFAPSASDPGMVHAMGAAGGDGQPAPWVFFVDAVITGIAFAIMTALYFLLWKLAASHAWLKRAATVLTRRWGLWLLVLAVVLVLLLRRLPPELSHYWTGVRLLLAGALILAATFALLCIVYSLATWFRRLRHTSYQMRRLFEGWAAVYLTLIAVLAVMGSLQNVAEWLTRPSAPVLVAMQEQTSVDATGAAVARPETSSSQAKTQESSGDAIGGLVALLAGLVAAGAAFLRSGKQVSETFRSWGFQVPGGLVATLATALILFGILVITHYVGARVYAGGFVSVRVSVGVLVAAVLSAWLVNSNYVSLGRFYRDRLMEAFMPDYHGALDNTNGPAPETADGMELHRASPKAPYHIVNTNVVLINARDRRRCIRGGDSFILTRDWCGSNATGWRATKEFMDDGMTLPTAVAISGAAANPNTGVGGVGLTRSRVVSVLMAFLNLRLGYWVPHPVDGRQSAVPNHFRPGFFAWLRGYHERYPFQELSDGGHFENLGIYELIRRRARLILVCDGVADPDFQFEDLQTALRRIGEDFGAKIRIPGCPSDGGPDASTRGARLPARPRARHAGLCGRGHLLPARFR